MSLIGDLERLVATSLYPLRVPIAIGLAVGMVGLFLIARRRGWFASARRHPRRTLTLVAVLLAIGGPVGWYLGSPLFIRTSLVEPAPAALQPSHAPEPAGTVIPRAPSATGSPIDAPPATPPLEARRTGSFKGEDDFHFANGMATLIQTGPESWVLRFEGFSVRNGPNLHVYLSPDPKGYVDEAIDLGPLKATDGSFNMNVPGSADVGELRSVVIWCKQFAVQFGVARLR